MKVVDIAKSEVEKLVQSWLLYEDYTKQESDLHSVKHKEDVTIYCISDTHGHHRSLTVPQEVDIIIHAGDSTNYWEPYKNEQEFDDFLDWYSNLNIKNKVLIAGNHDAWATKDYNVQKVKDAGIIYLEHEIVEIEGIKIFGSPFTPKFGNWYFNRTIVELSKLWSKIPEDTDILVTHGPPFSILDMVKDYGNTVKLCGDEALLKRIYDIYPRYHIFGHIHDNPTFKNQGELIRDNIHFLNVSCMTDDKFYEGPTSNGIIINYKI